MNNSKMGIIKLDIPAICETYTCSNPADYQLGYEDNGYVLNPYNICQNCLDKLREKMNELYEPKEIEDLPPVATEEDIKDIGQATEQHEEEVTKVFEKAKKEPIATNLESLSFKEIKDLCIENKLSCIGSKEAMIQRLKEVKADGNR